MSRLIDLTGQRFGRLVVVSMADRRPGDPVKWMCRCDCGNTKTVDGVLLRQGETRSCGCLHRELVRERMTTHGTKHPRLHRVWAGMLNRTRNPNASNYKYYGGRGICVCEDWLDYASFEEWALASGYNESSEYGKCTLDRIDDNGNYSPENCRWVDQFVQANNQRSNKNIAIGEEIHTMKEWSQINNLSYTAVRARIRRGWDPIQAVTQPLKTR